MSEMGSQTQMKKALFFDLYGTLIDINTDENRLWVY
jgi:FMN phosphatase YigB (HAD superfamily)